MSEPKLSEKEVAEIREAYRDVDDPAVHALLADRDAHLADLKEAREIIQGYRVNHRDEANKFCHWNERADAFLERTK